MSGKASKVIEEASTISASMAPCSRMKRMPSFMLVKTDSRLLVGTKCGWMINSEMMTAMNEMPFSEKHQDAPSTSATPPRVGPRHARDIELDGVQRDRIWKILGLYQRWNQRRVGRSAEGLRRSDDERKSQNVPDA